MRSLLAGESHTRRHDWDFFAYGNCANVEVETVDEIWAETDAYWNIECAYDISM